MSRQINISYKQNNVETQIDIGEWYMLGHQTTSHEFWSLPILKEIGIKRLAVLGHSDPVYFEGWEDLEELDKEISLLEDNIEIIHFEEDTKKRWLRNLRNSLNRLIVLSPKLSNPLFEIG
jgi:hypothetical protein